MLNPRDGLDLEFDVVLILYR